MSEQKTAEWLYDNGQLARALKKAVEELNYSIIWLVSRAVLQNRDRFDKEAVELAAIWNDDMDLRELRKDVVLKVIGKRPAHAPFVPPKPLGKRIAEMVE